MSPLLQVGIVEKTDVDRFLNLVGKGAGEDDPGNVGFLQLDFVSLVWKHARLEQGIDQCLSHVLLPLFTRIGCLPYRSSRVR